MKHAVRFAVIGLNDVLDEGLSLHPLEEQRESVAEWRQIGLGIMGLGDFLIKLGIRYGSKQSIEVCDYVGKIIANEAIKTSALLAANFGGYPGYDNRSVCRSPYFTLNASEETQDLVKQYGLRNSQLLTTAPTGTISTMLGISGGIEPIYANSYTRKTESLKGHDEYYKVYTPIVKRYMDEHNIKDESELPDYFVTAPEIDYHERIDMQAVWQKHIDASISSTVNLPNSTTVEEVEELYMYAWQSDLKGITIYRDGCKRAGILTTNDAPKPENPVPEKLERGMIIKADDNCIGKKRTLHTGCGTLHCEAFFDPATGDLLETYFSKGSQGGCQCFMAGLSRMISLAARGGVDMDSIVDQLKSSGTCPSYAVRRATKHDTSIGSSCPVAIGNALIDMYEEMREDLGLNEEEQEDVPETETTDSKREYISVSAKCPECGGDLIFEGGCNTCKNCGYSKCD